MQQGSTGVGLYVGMLADLGQATGKTGSGIFNAGQCEGPTGASSAERYKDKLRLSAILGGDENIRTTIQERVDPSPRWRAACEEGGRGQPPDNVPPARSGDYPPITSTRANWLDFNMFQSSHAARDHDNGLFTEHDYASEAHPNRRLDGEPRYEDARGGVLQRRCEIPQRALRRLRRPPGRLLVAAGGGLRAYVWQQQYLADVAAGAKAGDLGVPRRGTRRSTARGRHR